MLFVDGENLAIQAKDEAEKRGLKLVPGPHYVTDTFVWMPGISATQRWLPGLEMSDPVQPDALRAHWRR
jgi:hypothetical protein